MVAPTTPPRPTLSTRNTPQQYLLYLIRRLGGILFIALGLFVAMNLAWPRYLVEGLSMRPMFEGTGNERVIVNRLEYFINPPQRGDVVVMLNPENLSTFYIKRLIGLPGERIALVDGVVFINGQRLQEPYIPQVCQASHCRFNEWQLGPNEYFVLGDNRNVSHDSAVFGPVQRSLLIGRAWINYWPPEEFQMIDHYAYKDK
ncbi:MAG: signal peptidase I [Anaerolineales bacterium]